MTWDQLRLLLIDMYQTKHTSLDKPVVGLINGEPYDLDIMESLTSGDVFLTHQLIDTEETDGED